MGDLEAEAEVGAVNDRGSHQRGRVWVRKPKDLVGDGVVLWAS